MKDNYKINVVLTDKNKEISKQNQSIFWLTLSDLMFLTKKELKEVFQKIETLLNIKTYKSSSIYKSIKDNEFDISLLNNIESHNDLFIFDGELKKESNTTVINETLFTIRRYNESLILSHRNRILLIKINFFRELALKKTNSLYSSVYFYSNIKKKWIIDIANIIFNYKRSIFNSSSINTQSAYTHLNKIDKNKANIKNNTAILLKTEFGFFILFIGRGRCNLSKLPKCLFNTKIPFTINIDDLTQISITHRNKKTSLDTLYKVTNKEIDKEIDKEININLTSANTKKIEI